MVIRNALFGLSEKLSNFTIPYCTYTTPEIATCGLNEKQLRAKGIQFDTYSKHFDHNDRALCDSVKGIYKIYTVKGKEEILGCSLAGGPAGDLIGFVNNAMANKVGIAKLGGTVYPYPSYAEIFRNMSDAFNKGKLGPKTKKVL